MSEQPTEDQIPEPATKCVECGALATSGFRCVRDGVPVESPVCRECGRLQPVIEALENLDARLYQVLQAVKRPGVG